MRAGRETAHTCSQPSVNAPVDLANAAERAFALFVGTERQGEHRVHGVIETRDGGPGGGSEAAMVVDPGGDERMGELQEDRATPAEQDDALGVDTPGDQGSGIGDQGSGITLQGRSIRNRIGVLDP